MPYIAFGFDESGAGFDQAPFSSDINKPIYAVGLSPAAVGIASVQTSRLQVRALASSPPAVGVAQVLQKLPVTEQTFGLGAWGFGGFTGAILIEPDLIVGGVTAYLRQVDWAGGNGVSVQLASTTTDAPTTAGPEFIDAVENYSLAFTFEDSGGGSVVIGGPNAPGSSLLEPTEPYFWLPSNAGAWFTWYNNAFSNGYDVTLTIRSVPPPAPPRLDVSAFADSPSATALSAVQVRPAQRHPVTAITSLPASIGVAEAQVRPVQRHPVNALATLPSSGALAEAQIREPERRAIGALASSPTASGIADLQVRAVQRHPIAAIVDSPVPDGLVQVSVREVGRHAIYAFADSPSSIAISRTLVRPVQRLPIAAFAPPLEAGGLSYELNATIAAGVSVGTGNSDIYAVPPRGTSGTLVSGDTTLEATPVTRIRVGSNATQLILNDNTGFSFRDYFQSGGAGRDLTLHFTTSSGSFSIPIDNNGADGYDGAGGGFIRFVVDSAAQTILQGIDAGDQFTIAFARAGLQPAPVASTFVQVQRREVQRHGIQAFADSPAALGFAQVQGRSADRREVAAFASSPTAVSLANVNARMVERHPVTVLGTSARRRDVSGFHVAENAATGCPCTNHVTIYHRACRRSGAGRGTPCRLCTGNVTGQRVNCLRQYADGRTSPVASNRSVTRSSWYGVGRATRRHPPRNQRTGIIRRKHGAGVSFGAHGGAEANCCYIRFARRNQHSQHVGAPSTTMAPRRTGHVTGCRGRGRGARAVGRSDTGLGAIGISRLRSVGGCTGSCSTASASCCHCHDTAYGCPCSRPTACCSSCAGIRPIGITFRYTHHASPVAQRGAPPPFGAGHAARRECVGTGPDATSPTPCHKRVVPNVASPAASIWV